MSGGLSFPSGGGGFSGGRGGAYPSGGGWSTGSSVAPSRPDLSWPSRIADRAPADPYTASIYPGADVDGAAPFLSGLASLGRTILHRVGAGEGDDTMVHRAGYGGPDRNPQHGGAAGGMGGLLLVVGLACGAYYLTQ